MREKEFIMMKLENRKQVNRLTLLMVCIYMANYVTRTSYSAIISEIQTATSIPKSLLSMAVTGSFITYGIGLIISGILGDRISPKRMVSYGLILTVLMNLLIPVCGSPYLMCGVWCVNGFAQSFMWPPLIRIMTELLSETDYKNTMTKACWGSSFGTIAVYLISPLIILVLNWKWVFVFSAICGVFMFLVWNKYAYEIESEKKFRTNKTVQKEKIKLLFNPMMFGIMVAIILHGMLRDGVTTWMPSYISETYKLSTVISILTGVIIPIVSILCFQIATKLYIKRFKNPIVCARVFFAAGAISALVLFCFTGYSAAISVFFSAILTGCMQGVNIMLIGMIPPFFQRYGNVSTVSGVLNSCTYIGSAISAYGIAVLSEIIGWHGTIFVWLLLAVAGTVICFCCAKNRQV